MSNKIIDIKNNIITINDKPTVLYFTADWCKPCSCLSQIEEELTSSKDIDVLKIDIDDNTELMSKYKIKSVPTLIFLKDKVEVDTMVGLLPKDKIVEKFNKAF